MILVDARTGSGHFVPILNQIGAEAEAVHLDYGDVAFPLNGPTGVLTVGIEVKTVTDLISSMISRRLTTRQLPGMRQNYDVVMVAIIGRVRRDQTGGITEGKYGKWHPIQTSLTWDQLEGMKTSLRFAYGAILVEFETAKDFCCWVKVVEKWASRKWEDHQSHLPSHQIFAETERQTTGLLPSLPREPTNTYLSACAIPGVGMAMARKLAHEFPEPRLLANASMKELLAIKGLGKQKAGRIYMFYNQRRGNQ